MLIIAYLYQFASGNSNGGTKAAIYTFFLNDSSYAVEEFGEALPPRDLYFSGGMGRQSRQPSPEKDDSWRANALQTTLRGRPRNRVNDKTNVWGW
jgi:hypothetical protein